MDFPVPTTWSLACAGKFQKPITSTPDCNRKRADVMTWLKNSPLLKLSKVENSFSSVTLTILTELATQTAGVKVQDTFKESVPY